MKNKAIILLTFLILGLYNLSAQEKLFAKLSDNDNISVVYISKALLEMIPNMDASVNGADFKQLSNKLEQIEIYSCDNDAQTVAMMRNEMNTFTKNNTYESLMTVKEKEQLVHFLAYKQNNRFKDLIMYVDEKNSCTIIRIKGSFTSDDIKNVMNNTSTKK